MFSPEVLAYRPWSVSKMGTLDRCLRQYCYKYVERQEEGISPESGRLGTAVHAVLEQGLAQDCADPEQIAKWFLEAACEHGLLVEEMEQGKTFLDGCVTFIERARRFKEQQHATESFVELGLALDEHFQGVPYDDPRAFLRGRIDYSLITGSRVMLVFDHKTGRPKPVTFHQDQLYCYALLVAARYPDLAAVQPVIHHVGHPELQRMQPLSLDWIREQLRPWLTLRMNKLVPRILAIREGRAVADVTPLCRYCNYIEDPGCPEGLAWLRKQMRTPVGINNNF
jgi:hypothetical protein